MLNNSFPGEMVNLSCLKGFFCDPSWLFKALLKSLSKVTGVVLRINKTIFLKQTFRIKYF